MEEVQKKRLGAGKVAFFAREGEIKKMVDAGHTMISVYFEYKTQVPVSYGQFVNYVNKFIKGKNKIEVERPVVVDEQKRKVSTLDTLKAKPNKEELL